MSLNINAGRFYREGIIKIIRKIIKLNKNRYN